MPSDDEAAQFVDGDDAVAGEPFASQLLERLQHSFCRQGWLGKGTYNRPALRRFITLVRLGGSLGADVPDRFTQRIQLLALQAKFEGRMLIRRHERFLSVVS